MLFLLSFVCRTTGKQFDLGSPTKNAISVEEDRERARGSGLMRNALCLLANYLLNWMQKPCKYWFFIIGKLIVTHSDHRDKNLSEIIDCWCDFMNILSTHTSSLGIMLKFGLINKLPRVQLTTLYAGQAQLTTEWINAPSRRSSCMQHYAIAIRLSTRVNRGCLLETVKHM